MPNARNKTATATTPSTAATTDNGHQTRTGNTATTRAPGTTEIGGMSITLPFSSFTSAPAAPSLSAVATTADSSVGSSNATQPSAGPTNLAAFLAAQPLATKPVYKKRPNSSAPRPDGLIKRSGAEAAVEKNQRRQAIESATKPKGNIYDRSVKTRLRTLPALLAEQLNPPHKKQRIQKNKKIKATKPSRQPRPKPPGKPRVVRVPKIWTPHQQNQPQLSEPSQGVATPLPSEELASNANANPTATIEFLVKQQEAHRERLAQLAIRPLPLQELQTLVCTELEEEHESLKTLGILLHKELLKLRLEEGVMLNMLKISESGILDVKDLERVKARRLPSARQLEAYDRMNERHYQRKLRLAKAARASAIAKRAAMGVRSGVTEEDAVYAQSEQRDRVEVRGRRRARRRYVTEDEGEDEQEEEVEGENGEETTDREQTDTESTKPKYQFPGESYSFRPVIPSSQPRITGSIGQPQASSSPALVSLEEIKKLVIKRANKRTAVEMVEQEVEDDDLYELDFDEEEEQPVEEQRGQHDDDEIEQHQNMDVDNNQDGAEESGDEGEEDEEESEEEGEGEYYSSDEEGEGPGGDNEEDEDAARLALQRMLSIYGV